jgi:hypothetical protein
MHVRSGPLDLPGVSCGNLLRYLPSGLVSFGPTFSCLMLAHSLSSNLSSHLRLPDHHAKYHARLFSNIFAPLWTSVVWPPPKDFREAAGEHEKYQKP